MNKHFISTLCLLIFAFTANAQILDMSLLKGMKPRNIGPAGMSGRVTSIDVNLQNPDVIYVGTASGGLWKSEGGGVSWTPIFDSLEVASIGAIAIDQSNPDVIWVGTGEGNPRNSQTSGGGLYRSIDGGRTWQLMGLKETRNIHRIIIHKDDPNIIYVGAIGYAWGDSEHRGVYRSKDGGKSWKKVLYINNQTGAADFDVDPSNPNKLFVNMWQYRRWPWFFKSGGPGSGLFVSLDGGDTWTERTEKDGLPKGELGKIGISIAKSNPKVVYALIESKQNALYRSNDGGFTFKKVADKNIGGRPFYYWDIAVDPSNENRLYNVYSNVSVSEDGGKTFKTLLGWDNIHGDHHYWWIHPDRPSFMIDGNDGGLAITRDKGKTWRFVENLPLAQFYHIQVDHNIPYNVLGGMQDNGTWRGPSQIWSTGGIRNAHWDEIGFGDGFDVVVEHDNDRYVYVMWQGGNLLRIDIETGAQQWVKPQHPDGINLRFNWNAAIEQDPIDKGTLYYGSQYVHQSDDDGKSWKMISPDLTTNDPEKQNQKESGGLTFDVTGAENHCSIIAISASPLKKGVIWVGTDDGNIQLTKDGGENWTKVSVNLKAVPEGAWVPQIHASAYNEAEAYVVINDYRRDNWTPYLYRTRDYGQTWERVVDEKDVWGYCLSWVQDPIEPKLQFLGTEFGLYVSIDEGKNWTKWDKAHYPTVSTIDMLIHPRDHDLVIGTFGRAAFILDDIRPLRELASKGIETLDQALKIYPIADTYLSNYKTYAGTRFTGDAFYAAENRAYGALVSFSVKEILKKDAEGSSAQADSVKVEIYDSANKKVRDLTIRAKKGLNRFAWGLETNGIRTPGSTKPRPNAPIPAGHPVLPDDYKVRITYGDHKDSVTVKVLPDPRMDIQMADLKAFYAAWEDFNTYVNATTMAMDQLVDAKKRMNGIMSMIHDQVEEEAIKKQFQDTSKLLKKQIKELMNRVIPGPEVQGIFNDPDMLGSRLFEVNAFFSPAFGSPNPPFHGPTPNQERIVNALKKELQTFVEDVNTFFAKDWLIFEKEVDDLSLDITKPFPPITIQK